MDTGWTKDADGKTRAKTPAEWSPAEWVAAHRELDGKTVDQVWRALLKAKRIGTEFTFKDVWAVMSEARLIQQVYLD